MATTQVQKQAIVYQILSIHGIGPMSFWREFNKSKNLQTVHSFFKLSYSLENIQDFNDQGIFCLGFWQNEYPKQLKRLHDAPPLIWIKGNVEFLNTPQLAIVGGRNASFHGIKFAKDISEELSNTGFTIVSGLARGIDKAAHEGALCNKTIAVLAGGVDRLYPQENLSLYEELSKNHLVLSEMPPGVEPTATLFPRRNRIIAGLSSGVCVIEAALKSGSLLTAKYGLDIGLPIFSCPGHPYDPRVRGSNLLIKDGAYLLENITDITDQIKLDSPVAKNYLNNTDSAEISKPKKSEYHKLSEEILNYLNHTPIGIEQLLKNFASYPTEQVLTILSELELKNAIHRLNANLIVLA